eukprot:XP_011675632.1 PREDICTED: latent-transforming growth factor beta-binding protein 2-like [Strongylocentrotus purpuratus]
MVIVLGVGSCRYPPNTITIDICDPGETIRISKVTCSRLYPCSPRSPSLESQCGNSDETTVPYAAYCETRNPCTITGSCNESATCQGRYSYFKAIFTYIDECYEDPSSCDSVNGMCMNVVGSYICSCDSGYEVGSDGITCYDIDECSVNQSPCDSVNGSCMNAAGSYVCSCNSGYELGDDDITCNDIDECSVNPSPCDSVNGMCMNTAGSYICSCNSGYQVGDDEITCYASCPTLSAPANGSAIATTYMSGGVARFVCDAGFELSHVVNLTCQSDGTWSDGDIPTCVSETLTPLGLVLTMPVISGISVGSVILIVLIVLSVILICHLKKRPPSSKKVNPSTDQAEVHANPTYVHA